MLSTRRARAFARRELDRLGFLIDGTDMGESRSETERELARTARDVEKPALTTGVRAPAQVVEQRRGVRQAVLVVERSRPPKQVASELGLGSGRVHVERIETPAVPGAP